MARPKKAEQGLVARPVYTGEFDDGESKENALASTVESLALQNIALIKLLTNNYETIVQEKQMLANVVNESLKQQIELTREHQLALDKRAERKLKQAREAAHDELMREIAGDVKILLPLVLNKFTKGKAISEGEISLLRPFIEKFSEDELRFHMNHMSKAQQAAFVDMLNAIPDKNEKPPTPEKPNGAH